MRHDIPRRRWLVAMLCAGSVALPCAVVQVPPVTDLPQHLAQVRLFFETIAAPASPYAIQWGTPYVLVYAVLAGAWSVVSPFNAGRLAVAALAVAWVLAVHWLAAREQRPLAAAVLASVLCWSHILYWGFLSFFLGSLLFMVWVAVTTPVRPRDRWREGAVLFAGAVVLYFAHALWFAIGVLWLLVSGWLTRQPRRRQTLRLLAVSPIAIWAALWYPSLAARGFDSGTHWWTLPTGRLSFGWLIESSLGGLRGGLEPALCAVLALWLVVSWRTAPRDGARGGLLIAAGALLLGVALVVPDKVSNTLFFASRWVPTGVALVLLGMPAPRVARRWHVPLALTVLLTFSVLTAARWREFERVELAGLTESLSAVPEGARVLGLDRDWESTWIDGRPFLQVFAYAQVLHGATLNFSFADFAPSPVVYREARPKSWQLGLEWEAEKVRPEDLGAFDFVLVNGADGAPEAIRDRVEAVTPEARWRLYRVGAVR